MEQSFPNYRLQQGGDMVQKPQRISDSLRASFERNPTGARAKLFGILFTHPLERIAQEQILPRFEEFDRRSGAFFDFFIIGFERVIGGEPPYAYRADSFDEARLYFESLTTWRYSGDTDLILGLATYNGQAVTLDFSEALYLDVAKIISDGAYPSASRLFSDIIKYCEDHPIGASIDGLSDSIGVKRLVSLTFQAILELICKPAALLWKAGRHFAIKKGRQRRLGPMF